MARLFHLTIAEHPEYGELGIKIKGGLGRDYFEPALSGITLAHDLLEHPATGHTNGFADEFMALGAIVAGRIEMGWHDRRGRRIHTISIRDLTTDVSSLVPYCDWLPPCNSRIRDREAMDSMRQAIRDGLDEAEMIDPPNAEHILGWMCRGHQLFRRRFAHLDTYEVSNHLFDTISNQADAWLKEASEGQEATLRLDLTCYRAEIVTDY